LIKGTTKHTPNIERRYVGKIIVKRSRIKSRRAIERSIKKDPQNKKGILTINGRIIRPDFSGDKVA